ncbi:hypothetical protein [Weissella confusa]|uniref:hypothetical protein n=1 Tax=Weissella confusa TaxID=1583 RepID=UPI0018F25104|nr:hypothetical protein [Weissella confusa]MBJ7682275.1 hypothetical protein [Weissella confusa]MBJ7684462.1 hypothetical protein [Weissella confusa]MBJ7703090.1 hypothetical protein [Weissella confusa]
MTKYVIDLPEGVKFIVGKGYMMLSEKELLRIPVENLQEYNAPTVVGNATVEKRVIELPADVIAELKNIKEDNGDDNLQGFMNDVNDNDNLWTGVDTLNYSGMPTDALLGEWWLEHVDFVPKKEPRFIINVDSPTGIGRAEKDDNGNVRIEYYEFDVATRSFTEAEADELVAGLTALNARKVKVEE